MTTMIIISSTCSIFFIIKGKVTNIAEIKHELSVQLQYDCIMLKLRGNFQYLNKNG